MTRRRRRSLALALLLLSAAFSAIALGAPTFSDQDTDAGNLNPTNRVLVQEIQVTRGTGTEVIVSSVTVYNLGTATGSSIDRIEIENGATVWQTTNTSALQTGVTINMGWNVPAGTHVLRVYVTVGTTVTDGQSVRLAEIFHYKVDGNMGDSPRISDKSGETIRDGGFDDIEDNTTGPHHFNPEDVGEVFAATFSDDDANGHDVLWVQTGGATIVKVENLGTGETSDIDEVNVTIEIAGADYTSGWRNWNPASPMNFAYNWFEEDLNGDGDSDDAGEDDPLPDKIPDDDSAVVTVQMRIEDSGDVADGRTIRPRANLLVKEGNPGNEVEYEQTATAEPTQTIRKQGFELIAEESATLTSGTVTNGEYLEQIVTVTDDDLNNKNVRAIQIEVQNLGTAGGDELHSIEVKSGATVLADEDDPAVLADFKTKVEIDLVDGAANLADDDGELTLKIFYHIEDPDDGHTIQPRVRVKGREAEGAGNPEYWSDRVSYPDSITLYDAGLEVVENETPPEGGTAYSGQRLLAQVLRLLDLDQNLFDVFIHPVVVRNLGTAQENPDVVKIEVVRIDGDNELPMGEATDLSGFRTAGGGVTISTLQNNRVNDSTGGTEAFIGIYVTIAEPEDVVEGRKIKLETRVLHTEGGVAFDKPDTGNQWTLEINHRPVVDFTFEKVTTASVLDATSASIQPKQFTYEDTIQFTATVTDQDGAIDEPFTYLWDFGDGNTSTEQNPTHQYPNGGTFDVTLTVTDARGVSGTATYTITVEGPPAAPPADNDPPVAAFDVNKTTASVGEALQFTDQSTDPDGTVEEWAWNFGDGGTSTAENPTHAFMAAGGFTVSLIVTDNDGADSVQSASTTITVSAPTDVVVYGYPNPASTQATIFYNLPSGTTSPVLRIFDLVGRLVRRVELPVAQTTYVWNLTADVGGAVANGLYFCVVTAQNAAGAAIRSQIFKLLIDR